ncbi:hypothetical protein PG997_013039 [Apiospora hydei]|uniref:Uncharacterized protein n=1 Tax=Apiospora hydei TaxID=1337664 RepID=A0ABR1V5V1_9PEZI
MDRRDTPELLTKEQKLPPSAHPFVTASTTSAEKTTNSDTAVSQVAADFVALSNSVADGESDTCPFLPSLHGSETLAPRLRDTRLSENLLVDTF